MRLALVRHHLILGLACAAFWIATAAPGQSDNLIPQIKFTDVPITTAVVNLAHLTGSNLNIIVEPGLFTDSANSNGKSIPEPKVTLKWTNITARDALVRVLQENNLVMVQDKFSTVSFITTTNFVLKGMDASLFVSTNEASGMTNAPIPIIHFSDVPLYEAIKSLISQGGLNAMVDPKASADADPARHSVNVMGLFSVSRGYLPTVSLRWTNLTAKQAIVALCQAYNLVIVKDAATGVISIKPRE